jgi:hypothetical protein
MGIIDGGDGDDTVVIRPFDLTSASLSGGLGIDTLSLRFGGHLEQLSISGFEVLETDDNTIWATAERFEVLTPSRAIPTQEVEAISS